MTRVFTPLALAAVLGCASSSKDTPNAAKGKGGGPVTGEADKHCAGKTQATDPAVCDTKAPDGAEPVEETTPTFFNSEADDDDCKYHMKWTSTDVYQSTDVTFTLTLTTTTDGKLATGADPAAEVFLDETHPAPATDQKATETAPGVYTIGPVRFDKPGQWTVRFHVFHTCTDVDEKSPHGHGAFFVSVP